MPVPPCNNSEPQALTFSTIIFSPMYLADFGNIAPSLRVEPVSLILMGCTHRFSIPPLQGSSLIGIFITHRDDTLELFYRKFKTPYI